jgi:hypothetical protein
MPAIASTFGDGRACLKYLSQSESRLAVSSKAFDLLNKSFSPATE